MDWGKRIRAARKRANLTQAQLAEKIGVATITIRQYELEKRQPRIEQMEDIAYALNVEYSDLFGSDYKAEDVTKPDRVALRKAFASARTAPPPTEADIKKYLEHLIASGSGLDATAAVTETDIKFFEQINMLTPENKEKIRELVNLYLESQNKDK